MQDYGYKFEHIRLLHVNKYYTSMDQTQRCKMLFSTLNPKP